MKLIGFRHLSYVTRLAFIGCWFSAAPFLTLGIAADAPPVILTQPQNQSVYAGDEIRLSVAVSGTAPFGYEWKQNGRVIVPYGIGTPSLVLSNATLSQAGSYTVAVTNSTTSTPVSSTRAIVSVANSPFKVGQIQLIQESCTPFNQAIDPLEHVQLAIWIQNTNTTQFNKVLATLLPGIAIREPSSPQLYSGLARNGAAVAMPFEFSAQGNCGESFLLKLRVTDGTNRFGVISYPLKLGDTSGNCCGITSSADVSLQVTNNRSYTHFTDPTHQSITVSNRGPDAATSLVVTGKLPPLANLISAESSQGTIQYTSGILTFQIGTLTPGESASIDIIESALVAGMLTNLWSVNSTVPDPVPENNKVEWITEVRPPGVTLDFESLEPSTNTSSSLSIPVVNYLGSNGVSMKLDPSTALGILSLSPNQSGVSLQSLNGQESLQAELRFVLPLQRFTLSRRPSGIPQTLQQDSLLSWSIQAFNNIGQPISFAEESFCPEHCERLLLPNSLSVEAQGIRSVLIHAVGPRTQLFLDDWILATTSSNSPPQLEWQSPAQNQALPLNTAIPVSLSASDLDDLIARVDFYDGDLLIKSLNARPYSWTWSNPAVGYHTLRAIVTDSRGAAAQRTTTISVGLPRLNVQPSDLQSPIGYPAELSVSAEDLDGAPLRFQWYRDGLPIPNANQARLQWNSILLSESGDYFVEIINNHGAARSRTARVDVFEGTPDALNLRSTPRSDYWVADGIVHSVVETNNTVYLQGNFNAVYQNLGRSAVFDIQDGSEIPGFPQISGDVRAVIPDGEGGFFVGGYFNIAGVDSVTNLVRLRSDGSIDTRWEPALSGPVFALALQGGFLFAGGADLVVNGQHRGIAASFDAANGKLTPWIPTLTNAQPTQPAPSPRKKSVSTQSINSVALDGPGNNPIDLVPIGVDILGLFNEVYKPSGVLSIAAQSNKVFVAGVFNRIAGLPRYGLAALDSRTGSVLPWIADLPSNTTNYTLLGTASSLLVLDDRLYVCGDLQTINNVPRPTLAALSTFTGAVLPWHPNIVGRVDVMGYACGSLLIGGEFSSVDGKPRRNLAALDPQTGLVSDWNPDVDGRVTSLTTLFNTVYVGGHFKRVGNQPRDGFASIDLTSGTPRAWTPSVGAGVTSIGADPKKIWAAGNETYSGKPATNFVALDVQSGVPVPWDPPEGVVERLLADPITSMRCSWYLQDDTPELYQQLVNRVTVTPDLMYVGGNFTRVDGNPRNNIFAAKCDPIPALLPWDPGADREVNDIHVSKQHVYLGGRFVRTGGRIQPYFAAYPLQGAPTLALPLRGGVAITNSPFRFNIEAKGVGPFSYQWFLNQTNIPNATNATYEIQHATLADAGSYSVLISNPLGNLLSPEARLIVAEPVHITTQPTSQTVDPGTDIQLEVKATSNPPPLYQWRINGVNIPGADQPTLVISNAQPSSGGTYTVIIANPAGAVRSTPAVVIINSPSLPFSDAFAQRNTLSTPSGSGSFTTTNATREASEPIHAGKSGGRSIWLTWKPNLNGIATFNTRGSTFDTLLAVYTNATLASLKSIAEDEDRGGFATSLVSFNAEAGKEYHIAIDGFSGDSGHLVLSWSLDTSTVPFPRIILDPVNQSIPAGSDVVFSVSVASPSPFAVQWMYNCLAIPGETNLQLRLRQVQANQVGLYSARVTNASTRTVESARAILEVGALNGIVAQDKLEDLFPIGFLPGSIVGGNPTLQENAPPNAGTILIGNNNSGAQSFPTFGATSQPLEPNHCGIIGGASKWLRLHADSTGRIALHTLGSSVDTVIGVYQLVGFRRIIEVACDNDSAWDGVRSLARFNAVEGEDYYVAVDAVGGSEGVIQINWRMGSEARISSPIVQAQPQAGHPLHLQIGVTSTEDPPRVQWQFRDAPILGATNSMLDIPALRLSNAGIYRVVLSNLFGITTNVAATVDVIPPGVSIRHSSDPEWIELSLTDATPDWHLIQVSTNLVQWTDYSRFLPTNRVTQFRVQLHDTHRKFYRVVPAN